MQTPLRESKLSTLVFESRTHDVAALLGAAAAWLIRHPARVRDVVLTVGEDADELRVYIEDTVT